MEDRFRDVSAEWASRMTGALWAQVKHLPPGKDRFAAYEAALAKFEMTEAYKRLQMHREDV